jgi:hypothetical protein
VEVARSGGAAARRASLACRPTSASRRSTEPGPSVCTTVACPVTAEARTEQTPGTRERCCSISATSLAQSRPRTSNTWVASFSQPGQGADVLVLQAVVGALALAAHGHQPAVAQQAELVAGGGGGDLEQAGQVGDAQLVHRQRVQDARAGGVAQQREGLGQGQGAVHAHQRAPHPLHARRVGEGHRLPPRHWNTCTLVHMLRC